VYVQGHPHELLTRLRAEGKWDYPPAGIVGTSTDTVVPSEVLCFAGAPSTANVDTAYLVVKWTDGKRIASGDSILIWGYIFDSSQQVTSLDMLRAVANADCRFSVLLQNASSSMGYTVGGIGYNFEPGGRVPLQFNYNAAFQDGRIAFNYEYPPNCKMGQRTVPGDPDALTLAQQAIDAANNTGVIEHPLNINYGYPAYDYDYWVLTDPTDVNYEWQAGWLSGGYWSFYTKNSLNGTFGFSSVGVSSRRLSQNYVDGFVFCTDFSAFDMSGDYMARSCSCNPCIPQPE
jgi:hypothetical protein